MSIFPFDEAPVLESDRLRFRPHRKEDLPELAAMWADPLVVQHISGVPSDRERSWARLLRYIGHWRAMGFGYWALEWKADGRYIGDVGFADYLRGTAPSIEGVPEAGWVLSPTAHGKGVATEAVGRMLAWADEYLPAPKVISIFAPENAASIRVAEKNGFRTPVTGKYRGAETLFLERPRGG